MSNEPFKKAIIPPSFAGNDRAIVFTLPSAVGPVEDIYAAFVINDQAGGTALSKRTSNAGGGANEIVVFTPGVGGKLAVYIDVGDTAGLQGEQIWQFWISGAFPGDGHQFERVVAWGKWFIVPTQGSPFV